MWDKLLAGLRFHYDASPTLTSPLPLHPAGQPFPRTGYWQAILPENMHQREYFAKVLAAPRKMQAGQVIDSIGTGRPEDEAAIHWQWLGDW